MQESADSQYGTEDVTLTKRDEHSDEETSCESSIKDRHNSLSSVGSDGIPNVDYSKLAMVPVSPPKSNTEEIKNPNPSDSASSNTTLLSQTAKPGAITSCLSLFFRCSCFSAQKQLSSHHREYDAVKQKAGGPEI